jgi:hypothetical protein
MPTAHCVHCQTPIVDYSSVVEIRGAIYCCANCQMASRGPEVAVVPDLPLCEHCACAIVAGESLVERHGQRYCCYNCAAAVGRPSRMVAA